MAQFLSHERHVKVATLDERMMRMETCDEDFAFSIALVGTLRVGIVFYVLAKVWCVPESAIIHQ